MFVNAIKTKVQYRSFNYLQQHITKCYSIDARTPQHIFSEEQFQEVSGVQNSKTYPYNFVSKPRNSATPEENEELMSVWPEVMDTFTNACTDIPKLKDHLTTLLEEHVFKNKQAPGIIVPTIYKAFETPGKLSADNIKLANVLGCCVNMYQCLFIIMDDIVDGGEMRFGKQCWYARKDIGMNAVTDTVILENGIHAILRKYLSGRPCYLPAVELFRDVCLKCAIAMYLDAKTYEISGERSIQSFTPEIYTKIAKYKGCFPVFNFPVTLGIYLAEKNDAEVFRLANAFATELGLYFIAQNDFLEYYGNPATTGKKPSDIGLGKCTWLIVEALQHANPAQKQILSEHYGREGYESELAVRNIYDDLGMFHEFLLYENQSFNRACQSIKQLPEDVNKKYFFNIVDAMYNKKILV